MLHTASFTPQIPVQQSVRPCGRQHLEVERVVVPLNLVAVMHDLVGQQRTAQMPLGDGAVFVVGLTRSGVTPL